MTEPNYQKPPLREEIENFFKQLKDVIIEIIYIALFIAICIGLYKFSKSDMGQQMGTYFDEHFPTFMLTSIVAIPSYLILYMALYRKHLIYKRYRIGYFSQMMWCFIGFFTLQLINIPIAIYMNDLIPIIIVEMIALGITNLALSEYKKEHPLLVRPLTKEENELRKDIINALLNRYQISQETIETDAKAFARACYLMDFHPELFDIITTPNSGFTTPFVFYSDTLENPQNKLFIDIEESRYNLYLNRIYHLMKRNQKSDIYYALNSSNVFD